jgi:hypothetical protein
MKMNKIYLRTLFTILIIGISLSSCKKDKTGTDLIVGNWTAGTPTFTAMIGTKTITQYFTDVMGLTADVALQYTTIFNLEVQQLFVGTINFKSDNTYTSNLGGTPDSGTWSLSADGKTLTITPTGDTPSTATVTQLTSNKLVVSLTDTVSEDLNSDGTPETIIVTGTLPFTK